MHSYSLAELWKLIALTKHSSVSLSGRSIEFTINLKHSQNARWYNDIDMNSRRYAAFGRMYAGPIEIFMQVSPKYPHNVFSFHGNLNRNRMHFIMCPFQEISLKFYYTNCDGWYKCSVSTVPYFAQQTKMEAMAIIAVHMGNPPIAYLPYNFQIRSLSLSACVKYSSKFSLSPKLMN